MKTILAIVALCWLAVVSTCSATDYRRSYGSPYVWTGSAYWRSYVASSSSTGTAGGGIVTNYTLGGTNFTAHIFKTNATFSVSNATLNVEVLMVGGGGGGGGGYYLGAGGGAGGLIYTNMAIGVGSLAVVVGGGGARGIQLVPGGNGTNTTFNGRTAYGGGFGAQYENKPANGGGSSGGASYNISDSPARPVAVITAGNRGNIGGSFTNATYTSAGGGGGAGTVGSNAHSVAINYGAEGGDGLPYDISGISTYYAGGGGGCGYGAVTAGTGGRGGGGDGSFGDATSGAPNTGGGGGGGERAGSGTGGTGGSGIVIIRYARP